MLYTIKVIISAILIVLITEVSKANEKLGGLIKSLPIISILSFIWLYVDTKDVATIASLSKSTIWFIVPTIPMFIALPFFLNYGLNFYISLAISVGVMLICYVITAKIVGL